MHTSLCRAATKRSFVKQNSWFWGESIVESVMWACFLAVVQKDQQNKVYVSFVVGVTC